MKTKRIHLKENEKIIIWTTGRYNYSMEFWTDKDGHIIYRSYGHYK